MQYTSYNIPLLTTHCHNQADIQQKYTKKTKKHRTGLEYHLIYGIFKGWQRRKGSRSRF